jgi:hypothetical protein
LAAKDEGCVCHNGNDGNDRVVPHPFEHGDGIIFLLEPGKQFRGHQSDILVAQQKEMELAIRKIPRFRKHDEKISIPMSISLHH